MTSEELFYFILYLHPDPNLKNRIFDSSTLRPLFMFIVPLILTVFVDKWMFEKQYLLVK